MPSYSHVAKAVGGCNCPVLLNGNVTSSSAFDLRELTGAHGVMIGRSAIRNPWIFRQVREMQANSTVFQPTLG